MQDGLNMLMNMNMVLNCMKHLRLFLKNKMEKLLEILEEIKPGVDYENIDTLINGFSRAAARIIGTKF